MFLRNPSALNGFLNFKAAVLQMLKNNKKRKNIKINGKYWSSYVQWRNLLY